MKKILAVVLAVMVLFSAFSVSSSAEAPEVAKKYYTQLKNAGVLENDQIIISFDLLNSGASFTFPVQVYDYNSGTFKETKNVKGIYYMIPNNKDISSSSYMVPGSTVILPSVTPPAGKNFKGWQYTDFGGATHVLTAGSNFVIPEGSKSYGVICFTAVYVTGEIEGSILDSLLGVFVKIVTTVIGLMNLPIEEETIQKLLDGLL